MNLTNSLVVLALRSAGKEMDDTVRHNKLPQFRVCSAFVSTGAAHMGKPTKPYTGVPAPTIEIQADAAWCWFAPVS
jgi:hypothetical protein